VRKEVIAPSLSRSHIVKVYRIGGDRARRVLGAATYTECADTMELGRNEVMAKIAEEITHLVIRSLAFRVKSRGCRWLDYNKEHRVLVRLNGK
jgi:hypothetical protein